jgi:hypothetical protein
MDFERFKLDRDEKIFTASAAVVLFAFLELIYSYVSNIFGRPEADKIGWLMEKFFPDPLLLYFVCIIAISVMVYLYFKE